MAPTGSMGLNTPHFNALGQQLYRPVFMVGVPQPRIFLQEDILTATDENFLAASPLPCSPPNYSRLEL